jgi:subtilisin family serine protease
VQPLNEFESATAAAPSFDDPYARLQSNVNALDVAEAHNISRGSGIRVAIIDTGVDTEHPDLAGRTQLTRNYIDDDAREFRNDRHGTQVAGLIAASANNGIGTVGVAPEVRLLAFKACWQASPASAGRCNSFTLAQALADALAARAQIIPLSLIGPGDPLLGAGRAGHRCRDHYRRRGVRIPRRLSRPVPGVPGNRRGRDRIAERSDILRTGADIVTLVPNGHYDFASGSSLATAISGVVALLLAKNHRLGFDRLRDLLEQSRA